MEITHPPHQQRQPDVGPRKADPAPAGPPMSQSRAALLETLAAQPEPTTLAALSASTGLHANTVREHLEALEGRGLVQRQPSAPHGRGRPAWLYQATEPPERSEYAGLAATLAAAIHRTSSSPREDAIAAGLEWGRELARAKGRSRPADRGRPAARRQVVALLADIGFAPEADNRQSVVRLTRCPLLEAAHRYPDVVCGVHLGIVRGALEEYGADAARTELFPFSEPGACRLELMTRGPQEVP
ncbi:MAG: helix-turn-helix transcriptional regulator [Actinomycetes bacterium]